MIIYPNKGRLYGKLYDENNDAKPLLDECLDKLCEKTLSPARTHTPATLLTLAQLFLRIGDHRLACEVIWCSASLVIQDFIRLRGLTISLYSHNGKRRFMQALSREIAEKFSVFEVCHSSFYTNCHNWGDVNYALERANELSSFSPSS